MEPAGRLLFGRQRELDELRAALRGARNGRGSMVLLVGEPGIGKTRLAAAFAEEAAGGGFGVSWGRAWEAGGAPAYWPWIEALRPLAAADRVDRDDLPRQRIAPLARVMPELAAFGPPPPQADPAQERFRIFDAAATLLGVIAQQRPLVLVLDDLHAADLGTLALLRFVARSVHTMPVVLVGTYRDVEARLSEDAGEAIAKIAREGRYLAVGRLGRDEIAQWVAAEGCGDADTLFAATEGNPLFVTEILRLAREGEAPPVDRLPDGVRGVIRTRLSRLSKGSRDLLDAASVLGRTVDIELAATLAGIPLVDARDLAAEASRVDVLIDASDHTSFSHILVRDVLYQELPASRRADLHARVGRTLAQRLGDDGGASLAEAVHHLFAGAPVVPPGEAIAWARRASARAIERLAFEEAAAILERAIEHLPAGNDEERCDLMLDLAAALGGAGATTHGRQTAVAAAELARKLDDAERLAQAALRCGTVFLLADVDAVLIGLLEEAIVALPPGDHPLRARLLARLAAARQPAPDPDEPIAIAREALQMAGRIDDRTVRLDVLSSAGSALAFFGDPRERLALDEELVALAEQRGDRIAAMRGLLRVVFDHLELADVDSADRAIDRYDQITRAFDLPMMRWRAPLLRAMRALMDGRFDDSETLCDEAAAIAESIDDSGVEISLALHTAGRLWASDRLDELQAHLPSALELVGRIADPIYVRSFRLGMLARVGRAAEARGELEALVHHDPPLRGRPMLVWAADACIALGDTATAPVLVELLQPLAHRRFSWSPLAMVMEPPIADWLGRLRGMAPERSSAPQPTSAARPFAPPAFELIREGDSWLIRADTEFRLRDSRGLQVLAQLVAEPGRELHVTDLLAPAGQAGLVEDAGDMLDATAKAAYERRLDDLREIEREAVANQDLGRASRARDEIEALAEELARAFGLGGRGRKASSTTEKARVNVRQRVKAAIRRIAEHSPALAKHLRQAVHTGTYCRYEP